jgi:hypothetical protein
VSGRGGAAAPASRRNVYAGGSSYVQLTVFAAELCAANSTALRRGRCGAAGKRSLGDATSSLGDAQSSLGDAPSSLGDATSSLGAAESSLGDVRARWVTLRARWVTR